MHLRLDLPYIDRQSERGRLRTWLKEPGDPITPGEPICEVVIEGIKMLEIPRNAKLLTKLTKTKVKTTSRETPLSVAWRVMAREPGTLAETRLSPGDAVEIGTTLAVVSGAGSEGTVPDDVSSLSTAATSVEGVDRAFAVKAGKELRVIVDAARADDRQAHKICRRIAKTVEKELSYPGQIKVSVVRETRAIHYAV